MHGCGVIKLYTLITNANKLNEAVIRSCMSSSIIMLT